MATVFPDDNKKYLSTDLLREEPIREEHVSTEIRLVKYIVHGRVCQSCATTMLAPGSSTI